MYDAHQRYLPSGNREHHDAGCGHRRPGEVQSLARAGDRHRKRADELDGDRDAEGDTGNRLVEAQVHGGDDQPKEHDGAPLRGDKLEPAGPGHRQQNQRAKADPNEDRSGRTQKLKQPPGDRRPDLNGGDRAQRIKRGRNGTPVHPLTDHWHGVPLSTWRYG